MTLPQRQVLRVLADAFSFVRGREASRAIASVTLDQLIQDQILRNGESNDSNNARFDPYAFDPGTVKPAGAADVTPANFAGGSDTNAPTKLAQILAIKNNLKKVVEELKKTPAESLQEAVDTETERAPDLENTGSESLGA